MNEIEAMAQILNDIADAEPSGSDVITNDELQDVFADAPEGWERTGFFIQRLGEMLLNTSQRARLGSLVSPERFALAVKKFPSLKRAGGYEKMLPKDKFVETLDGEILEIPD